MNRVFVDTNILITATESSRAKHAQAQRVFMEWPRLFVSGQVLREYLVVATRPLDRNGLGMDLAAALQNVAAFRAATSFLSEDRAVSEALLTLLREVPCSGKQIHDAQLVATALTHNVGSVLTQNVSDFERYQDRLRLIDLP